jgi:hypothetical protein
MHNACCSVIEYVLGINPSTKKKKQGRVISGRASLGLPWFWILSFPFEMRGKDM